MTAPRPNRSRTHRILLTTIAFLIGIITALIGGILQTLDHESLPQAIEYGCGVFATTVVFTFAVFHFIDGPRDGDS